MISYEQTLSYLYERLPMFQRIGAAAYKANLDNTIAICNHLKNPEHKFKSIHVAGTNGKGSTSHMLASILQHAGYKVGLYTSPHLKDFRERIKINGSMISQEYIVDFVEKHKKSFEAIEPSFFEWTVGLAFDYFANEKVDIAVIEVGLGGRLDSTNVITPLVSVITNISYDHVNLLGYTLPQIAGEKAGIIKTKVPVVISSTQTEVKNVFEQEAFKQNADIYFADEYYKLVEANTSSDFREIKITTTNEGLAFYKLDLKGSYQDKNLPGVLMAIALLNKLNWKISDDAIKKGLEKVISTTGLLGRWQLLNQQPSIVCDTGHNEAGIKEVLFNISQQHFKKLHVVLGVVADKDISKILHLLSEDVYTKNATYYFCKAAIPRALNADELKQQASVFGLNGNSYVSVTQALAAAKTQALPEDMIFIGGSTFTVAEVV